MVFASGVGAEVLAPMALPVLGGLLISDEVVDLFLPVRFFWVRRVRWQKLHDSGQLNHQRAAVEIATTTEHDRASLVSAEPTGTGVTSTLGNAEGSMLLPSTPGEIRV
jgi:hypothetical protein